MPCGIPFDRERELIESNNVLPADNRHSRRTSKPRPSHRDSINKKKSQEFCTARRAKVRCSHPHSALMERMTEFDHPKRWFSAIGSRRLGRDGCVFRTAVLRTATSAGVRRYRILQGVAQLISFFRTAYRTISAVLCRFSFCIRFVR